MIAAVDLGTTNMKAALYGADGTRLANATRPFPYTVRTSGRVEFAPDAACACFRELITTLCRQARVCSLEIRKVSLTSQAQTFCVTDSSGRPVSPFYGWSDTRAAKEAAELQQALGTSFHRQSGCPKVSPAQMISKVLWWLRRHGWSNDHRFVLLPSFLAMQSGADHATDTNLAAMSGFFSIPSRDWWGEALDVAGISAAQLGALVAPGYPIAANDRSGFFPEDLKVVMAGNDHSAGAVGCCCDTGISTLTLGTAGVIYRRAGERPGPYSDDGLWGPYPSGGYYELICLDHACSALDWADEYIFGTVDSPRFVERAQSAKPGENTVFFFPDQWGSSEAWSGTGTDDEKAYAVIEGIGFAVRVLAGKMGNTNEFLVLGGGSRLDFWVQLISNILRRPITRSSRDGLDGAAVLAGNNGTAEHQQLSDRRFLPETSQADRLERRYRFWLDLHAGHTRHALKNSRSAA